MRKVKNKKVIQNLAKKSFGANRTRNRIAILAVALTTLLFTTIFTLGIGTMEIFQRQTMRQSGGDSHGVMKNLMNVGFALVSKAYLKEHAEELTYQYDVTGSMTGAIRMDVNFANSRGIQKKLN